jgi:hypothetical protein
MGTDARSALRGLTRAALTVACAFASLACASSTKEAAAPAAGPTASGIARYLPLADATVFSYETTTEPGGERGLLVLEVRRPRADIAELIVAGRTRRMNVTPSAVAHVTGGFLLREPLAVGAHWQGDFGHVRITSVERRVVVPAGTFEACVETVEEMRTDAGAKRTTTSYCPNVGITLRETEAQQAGEEASERIALKSYGARFQPPASGRSSSTSE